MYDYLIVGAGLYGSVCAYELCRKGYRVLVIDKRNHIGGNIYTESIEGINVHKYGAHIFHTSDERVWDYVNRFAEFNHYVNSPLAVYKDELYNLPFNMNTFSKMWGIRKPQEAKERIEKERERYFRERPKNLEEQAINLVGTTIYEKLIKGYTAKQWGKPCSELPPFIIKRLPVRFTYDNNYFNDKYQGIPIGGYTKMIEKMLADATVRLNTDFFDFRKEGTGLYAKIIYTGPIDEYFGYEFGPLEYRSLNFEHEILEEENYQGNAVVNYTDEEVTYTRIIKHKHLEKVQSPKTVISREYSKKWSAGEEPYYPVNDEKNNALLANYVNLAEQEKNVFFGGRLGTYRYLDMDKIILSALEFTDNIQNRC